MEGDAAVLAALNSAMEIEWTASEVYLVQRQLWRVRGYHQIAKKQGRVAHQKRHNLRKLSRRIIFLGGVVSFNRSAMQWDQSGDLLDQVIADLNLELQVDRVYRLGMNTCLTATDQVSYDTMENLIKPTEKRIEKLEAMISLAQEMGRENWIQAHSE